MKSESTNEIKWLNGYYSSNKERAFKLGVSAIDSLLKEGKRISYRSVALRAKEIDPEGKGIHANTLKTNEDLYLYYLKHCNSTNYNDRIDKSKIMLDDSIYRNIKLDRDIESVKKRYSRLSKSELIALLINAEQYIAEQNQIWLKQEFEKFS